MKPTALIAGFALGLVALTSGKALAQAVQTETKYVTVDGEVVRYEAGHVIVVRGADEKEVIYNLSPSIVVPAEVKVGGQVTLYTEPGTNGGTQTVSRVTTTKVNSKGKVKKTTEETRTSQSGATTRTTTTNISGRVEAYEAGKTLTVTRSDGSKVTYVINATSRVPSDLVIGKTITILPMTTTGSGEHVVQTITYTTESVPQD